VANIALALKETISRLAKKEIRTQTSKTKQAVAQYRRDIAKLKREIQSQQKRVRKLEAERSKGTGQAPVEDDPMAGVRFSTRSVIAQRKRLKLSAEDYGKLVGVSPLTIYHWEKGTARPRKAQLAGLAAMRGIGKREAMEKLKSLGVTKKKARKKSDKTEKE
jgi:DNA-binding transcriptional regulator YiaG